MNKATFKEKVMECINQDYKSYIMDAEKVINHMDEKKLEGFEDDYFAPNAFCEALRRYSNPKHTAFLYGVSYVRRFNKAVKMFWWEILGGRY